MNLFTTVLLVLSISVIAVVVWRIVKHVKFENARRAAIQPRVDWAEKIMAAKTDKGVLSLVKPNIVWDGKPRFPDVVTDAERKVKFARTRKDKADARQKFHDTFEAAIADD